MVSCACCLASLVGPIVCPSSAAAVAYVVVFVDHAVCVGWNWGCMGLSVVVHRKRASVGRYCQKELFE